ncbi:hypothetical protein DUNSADRAFT_490 [Dunaliella salina]|uniref:Encoded protein n=1 Tax=Dunaliella salina TaxID=3046 RepID=A0ABQ7FYU3_DUNSA|nr:hypothetical protein DUNSADRAFT_490 [Dunaliella salina]|eukprot:KAF5827532.1 hypothetical protein DUNSADRAFT_490 [Dunaliella salina]
MSSTNSEDDDVQVVSRAPPLGDAPHASSSREPVEQQLKRMLSDMQRANKLEAAAAVLLAEHMQWILELIALTVDCRCLEQTINKMLNF